MAKVSLFPWTIFWKRSLRRAGMAVQSRCCASGRVCSSVPHYQSSRQRGCALQCHYSSTQAPGSRSLLTGCRVVRKERPPSQLATDGKTKPPGTQGPKSPWGLQCFSDSYFSCTLWISEGWWRMSCSIVWKEKSRPPLSLPERIKVH